MKSSWIGIGFSHHRVPSLSKTAILSSGAISSGLPSVVARSTNCRTACFGGPSCQLGSGSQVSEVETSNELTAHVVPGFQ